MCVQGLSRIIVAGEGCIEGAENAEEAASHINVLEEGVDGVGRIEEGGERTAGVPK